MAILDDVCRLTAPKPEPRCFACPKAGRLAGYENVNDAERLCRDPAMHRVDTSPLRRRVVNQLEALIPGI